MDTLSKFLEISEENKKGLFEIIDMKDERLTYQEARIAALEKELEKLNIEIINLEIKIQLLEDGINK